MVMGIKTLGIVGSSGLSRIAGGVGFSSFRSLENACDLFWGR